ASSTVSSSIPTFALRSDGSLKDGMFLDMEGADIANVRSLVSANGLWEIGEDGTIRAVKIITNEIVADNIKARLVEAEQVKAKEVEAGGFRVFRSAEANKATVGEGRILRGETETTIYSSKVASTSKIFVSFTSDLGARSWFISQKSDPSEIFGGSTSETTTTPGFFTVRISAPLPDDASFDWWAVETAGTVAPAPITNAIISNQQPITNNLQSAASQISTGTASQTSTGTNTVLQPSADTTTAITTTATTTITTATTTTISSGATADGASTSSATTTTSATTSDLSASSTTATASNASTSPTPDIVSASTTVTNTIVPTSTASTTGL
ncbi:hypothetical protein KGQ34_03285, partial [Patescibacteria group bacterium]|nr:hypothetical protein [Patescibacteria group bacterium]